MGVDPLGHIGFRFDMTRASTALDHEESLVRRPHDDVVLQSCDRSQIFIADSASQNPLWLNP